MSWNAERFTRKRRKVHYPPSYSHHRKGQNVHHLTPVSRQGGDEESNLIYLRIERHNMLHEVFGNRTLEEIIEVLIRIKKMKHR